MSSHQSRHLTLHRSLFPAATFNMKQHQVSWWSVIKQTRLIHWAGESHLFIAAAAATCFNVRIKCSENPYWYLQFNQKIAISVPEHLHVQSLQTAATGNGRTNKISFLNLPFMLLMSAAGILVGVCSHVCADCYNDSKNVLLLKNWPWREPAVVTTTNIYECQILPCSNWFLTTHIHWRRKRNLYALNAFFFKKKHKTLHIF